MTRIDCDFTSQGTRCAAWLFLPPGREGGGRPPIVVMAHGFGGQREMRLPAFAERFAARGLAALVFDYRCFGASDGVPRNWISPRRHLDDWRAAIDHARGLAQVDGTRMALWGTSFSGGHVLALGGSVRGLSAIVAQVPFVGFNPRTAPPMSLGQVLRAVLAGWEDLVRAAVGASPRYVPIVGAPDEFAFLNTSDVVDAFRELVPADSTWRNEAPARILFEMRRYQPLRDAARIECPVLLVAAENDSLIAVEDVDAAAERIPVCEYVRLDDTGHFEPYVGPVFERVVAREAEFLAAHLIR